MCPAASANKAASMAVPPLLRPEPQLGQEPSARPGREARTRCPASEWTGVEAAHACQSVLGRGHFSVHWKVVATVRGPRDPPDKKAGRS